MLVALALAFAFVLVLIWGSRGMRDCRWRLDRTRSEPGRDFYRCAACGAETFTATGRRPRGCAMREHHT